MTFDEQLKRAFDTLSERLHDEVARQVAATVAESGASPVSPQDPFVAERLLEAVVAIDSARSLHTTLDTLVEHAQKFAERAALLLVGTSGFRGWRLVGFDTIAERPSSLDVQQEAGGVLADAVRTSSSVSCSGPDRAPRFAAVRVGEQCFAAPLILGDEAVAVLYADRGRHAGWPEALEILARHAARCLEARVALKAARFVTGSSAAARTGADTWSEDEQASARRYARLLTSEIKLYHEAEVIAGRQSRDLVARLGGEIARARTLYEQRVPVHVRERSDYFQAELVRTLADGDASLLEVRS